MEWLNMFNWLAYSNLKKGGFCKYCVLFPPSDGGKGNQPLRVFVTEPFVNYKKGLKLLRNHGSTDYHQLCIEKGSAFLQNFNAGGSKSISIMIDDKTKKIVEANKQRLTPIIKTIIFCG
ncbi:uncharacterized protein LOC112680942 isoform X2 [Sipha flava]|uniref:Uncharacterized protein LOC112680942 isoform X2 n=1 Tax=Sipha flava TaxID=143950 RepID=A0A8B8F9B1_9HEMI|nr:uncharacterized protein LOC112680942 isoform X2 [Sipha flava]